MGWWGGYGPRFRRDVTGYLARASAHLIEHDEAMYDQALLVTASLGMGTEYVTRVMPDGTKESHPTTKVRAEVHNRSRRPIHNVLVTATTESGDLVGKGRAEFVQAGWDESWEFDPAEKSWGRRGPSSAITGQVALSYKDIDETAWVLFPDGRLIRSRRPRGWLRQVGAGLRGDPTIVTKL